MFRVAAAALTLLLMLTEARAEDLAVAGFALPARGPNDLQHRAEQIAAALARTLGGHVQPQASPMDLSEPFGRAAELYRRAAFDRAAALFDTALERALRSPHVVGDTAALISAMIARANIATARGESRRADELLNRLLRYDPTVTLGREEDDPEMH